MKPSKTSLMCTILAVALALRVINLTTSLWYDELYTYVNFIRGGPADALLRYRAANNHPLYSLCAWLSLSSTPGSLELSLRLPALLLGLTTIALLMRRGGALLGASGIAARRGDIGQRAYADGGREASLQRRSIGDPRFVPAPELR